MSCPPDRRLSPAELLRLWVKYTARIPTRFALGTAQHESNLCPSSVTKGDQKDGSSSDGLYQLSFSPNAEGTLRALYPLANLLDAEDNTKLFVAVCERRLDDILKWSGRTLENATPDVWAYLGMAHNMGPGATKKTIEQYGLNWAAYKARNPALAFVAKAYGDDVITGGRLWTPGLDAILPDYDNPPDLRKEVAGRSLVGSILLFLGAVLIIDALS